MNTSGKKQQIVKAISWSRVKEQCQVCRWKWGLGVRGIHCYEHLSQNNQSRIIKGTYYRKTKCMKEDSQIALLEERGLFPLDKQRRRVRIYHGRADATVLSCKADLLEGNF